MLTTERSYVPDKKNRKAAFSFALDETIWKFYSRKIIPGTLNRRTILGWTTVRGRIGSRGSKRTSRNGLYEGAFTYTIKKVAYWYIGDICIEAQLRLAG